MAKQRLFEDGEEPAQPGAVERRESRIHSVYFFFVQSSDECLSKDNLRLEEIGAGADCH